MRRVLEWALSHGVEAAQRMAAGLPAGYLEELGLALGLSGEERARIFGLSRATWSRRRREGVLRPREAELVYRLARIYAMALLAFGEDAAAAQAWLRRRHPELAGWTPLEAARHEPAAREAEAILARARGGVGV